MLSKYCLLYEYFYICFWTSGRQGENWGNLYENSHHFAILFKVANGPDVTHTKDIELLV